MRSQVSSFARTAFAEDLWVMNLQQAAHVALKRFEEVLRLGITVLTERGQQTSS
jgi:hypothetical protein